jgi:hypothetical protein
MGERYPLITYSLREKQGRFLAAKKEEEKKGEKVRGSAVERGVIALCDVPVVPFAPSRRPEEKVGIFLDALVAALDCSAASKNLIDNAVYLRVASTREIE